MVMFGSGLQLQAATPAAGFALADSTPNILTWTAPNDGQQHRALIFASAYCASAAGGAITIEWTDPSGHTNSPALIGGNQGSGFAGPPTLSSSLLMVEAGTTVTIAQGSNLTGGTETLWAEIWGS